MDGIYVFAIGEIIVEKNFEIRHAMMDDYEAILKIYERARKFMRETGNPNQWNTKWPPAELVKEDIEQGRNYVVTLDGVVHGVFVYLQGVDIDPTYRRIENGAWLDDSEYGVIHRLAVSGEVSGAGRFALSWAYDKCHHLRVDTHGDNVVMQRILENQGFKKTGIIYVIEDNDPRFAFEKSEKI